ncbi:MAG: galactose mutarotase [Prevotellaceae bacterium]|jgi:aldose 1-epimerase|nr:galactose mutarotase [Prevotellaceae bacterium]
MMNSRSPESNLSGLKREDFQKVIDGKETDLFILKNHRGMEVALTNYGCAILSIMVPDKAGKYANVVLGHDNIDCVVNNPEPFLNTIIGRYANRIANGYCPIGGGYYQLAQNAGPNTLHGGPTGFHTRVWEPHRMNDSEMAFTYTSRNLEENYPGNLTVKVKYSIPFDTNELCITYEATTDEPTLVNLTNHAFFNLAGAANPTPSVLNHEVTINADFYLPITAEAIPTGEIRLVEGTPMDFRTPHTIGKRIHADFEQLKRGSGYDHCYVLNKIEARDYLLAATCYEPQSGRVLEVYTDQPGLQLYTGNWLSGFTGAHGATFPARSAVCFEAQLFPDTPNRSYFPSALLNGGEVYHQSTAYRFDVRR